MGEKGRPGFGTILGGVIGGTVILGSGTGVVLSSELWPDIVSSVDIIGFGGRGGRGGEAGDPDGSGGSSVSPADCLFWNTGF